MWSKYQNSESFSLVWSVTNNAQGFSTFSLPENKLPGRGKGEGDQEGRKWESEGRGLRRRRCEASIAKERKRNLHQSWDVLGTNVACIKETKIYCRLGAFWLNFGESLLVVSVNLFHFGASIRKAKLWSSHSISFFFLNPHFQSFSFCIDWYSCYPISKNLIKLQ